MTDEWVNKTWYIHTVEYYSAIKRNEVLNNAATWLTLEKIILSEICQIWKEKHCMIPPIWNTQNRQIHRDRKYVVHQGFSSVAQSCPTLCNPMNRSTQCLPAHHQLPEFTQTHVHRAGDAIQPSHPLSSPSPPAPNPSQHQGLFLWVNSLHEVTKVLEFQLHHQSFQLTPRTDL